MAYATDAVAKNIFGTPLITEWTDKDRDGSADAGVVSQLLADADDYIDRAFKNSRYQVPLEQLTSSSAPTDIVTIASKMYGYYAWLHSGQTGTQYEYMGRVKQEVDEEIAKILATGSLSAKEN